MTGVWVAVSAAIAAFLAMLGELMLSRANERRLRAQGAREPQGDVYRTMQWSYPLCFAAMAAEGAWRDLAPGAVTLAGLATFAGAKALKYWAIASLGPRWTFRVLVLPQAPLVTRGPYAVLQHPNYVAIMGELLGMAMLVGAPITGALALAGFSSVLRRRIAVENRALGRQSFTRA